MENSEPISEKTVGSQASADSKLTEPEQIKNDSSEDNNETDEVKEHPFSQSVNYLEKHRVIRLFQNLAAEVVYERPDNPLEFIANKLEANQKVTERAQGADENTADQVADLLS